MAISTDPPYAELRAKTNFSFLEGASHPEELVTRAKELGLAALAVTDRCGLYGIVRAHTAAKKVGLPLVVGSELSLADGGSVVLLAASRKGYGNLCRLVSTARQRDGWGTAKNDPFVRIEEVDARSEGLLALTPAPYHEKRVAALRAIFGGRLSLALHRTLEAYDVRRTLEAFELSKKFAVPIAAVNDVHTHDASRQPLQDVLTAIRHRTTLAAAGHLLFPNAERRLKSPAEMVRLFRDRPDALVRTVEIAGASSFSLDELRYVYPDEFLPTGKTAQGYLEELAREGAARRYPGGVPAEVTRQIEHELRLIRELSFADYFLTIWDIVTYARSQGILCQGRGSAANSAVCYALGITAIDPVRMDLLFERFISAERGEPPDIDVDFEHERREEVIQYIYRRYGRERAGMVCEVISYRSRSALREVAKALGVPFAEATRLSTAYHRRDHGKVDAAFLAEQGIDPRSFMAKKLIEIINQIKGFPRHISTHVGGFILTREPLVESVPIQNAAMENRTVIQWAKDDLARLGMLKVDILGLGILTAIRKCLGTIGEPLTLATIPAEDPKVYDMICRADTVGVFQVESRAQMGMLPRLRPRTFHDLVIEVAIVRPGPIQGRMVHPFLRRRRGEEKVFYAHPKLEPILKKTCGVPLFQEQVMKIAMAVADFTPGEADELRRAMGIWRTRDSVKFGELREKLVGRMRNNGIAAEHALSIFHQIESFGEFGFPESHSASFALLVYASAYLKLYHPAAYAAALINSQPMGFYAPHSILDDARRHGVAVLPIDVTRSAWDLTIENGAIRLGFRLVRGMGEKAARRIEAERAKRPFESLEAFAARTGLNRGLLFHLASADAFRAFGIDRREAVWKLRALVTDGDDLHAGQPLPEPDVRFPELTDAETVTTDFAFTGTSTYAHPVSLLRDEMERLGVRRASELPKLPAGRKIRTGGLVIVRQSPPTARGMVFLTLEDETGFVNVAFRPDLYDRLRRTVSGEPFLVVEGILQRDGLATSLLASAAWGLPFEAGLPDLSRNFH